MNRKTEEYLELLDQVEGEQGHHLSQEQIEQRLGQLEQRKARCKGLQSELAKQKTKGEIQLSTVDKDARKFKMPNGGTHICTNIQSAVDAKNKLIADYEVTNKDAKNALSVLSIRVKKEFNVDHLDVLADAGYPAALELKKCADENITTYVSPVTNAKGKFGKDAFIYDPKEDHYRCPEGQLLRSKGQWRVTKGRSPHNSS